MKSSLRATVDRLAQTFTDDLLALVRGASVGELTGGGWGSSGSGDVRGKGARAAGPGGWTSGGHDMSRVVKALRGAKDGMRSEQLQKELGLPKAAVVRAVNRGLASGTIRKSGQRRGTRYFAA